MSYTEIPSKSQGENEVPSDKATNEKEDANDIDNELIIMQDNRERYHPVMFNILGITSLLPFNCIIVPVEFWMKFYPSTFLSTASTSYNVTNWASMIFMILKGYQLRPTSLFNIALLIILITLIVIPIMEPACGDNMDVKVVMTLIPILFIGIGNAMLTPTIFSISSLLNSKNNAAIMAGQGVAGILTEAIYAIVKACISGIDSTTSKYENALFWSTMAYFLIAAGFVIVSYVVWGKLVKKYSSIIKVNNYTSFNRESLKKMWSILKILTVPALAVFFNFTITLSIFPSITVLIPYNKLAKKNAEGDDNGWYNVIFMALFMVFDWAGRQSTSLKWLAKSISLKSALVWVVCRVIFYAFFFMEALPKYEYDDLNVVTEHPLINSDTVACLTMIVFAYSNGLFSSISMMKYSELISNSGDLTLAGNAQTFCLNSGLLAGCLIGIGISAALS